MVATTNMRRADGSVVLGEETRARLRRIADAHGMAAAAKLLGCGREALARAIGGLPLKPRTACLLTMQPEAPDAA